MLTYNTNSKTGPVCGDRALEMRYNIVEKHFHYLIRKIHSDYK